MDAIQHEKIKQQLAQADAVSKQITQYETNLKYLDEMKPDFGVEIRILTPQGSREFTIYPEKHLAPIVFNFTKGMLYTRIAELTKQYEGL